MRLLALGYLALVLVATLAPAPWGAPRLAEVPFGVLNPATWLSPTTWTTGTPGEFLVNIALFVPIGFFASRLFSPRVALLAPLALTLFIELVQIPLPDRASDPRDLVANALGGIVGIVVARVLARRRTRMDVATT